MKVTILHIRGHSMYQIPTSNLATTYTYISSKTASYAILDTINIIRMLYHQSVPLTNHMLFYMGLPSIITLVCTYRM